MTYKNLEKFLKNKLGVTKLSDIARELDVSPQTVNNWKTRDKVPYKYVSILREKHNELLDYINESHSKVNSDLNTNSIMVNQSPQFEIPFDKIFKVIRKEARLILIFPTITCLITIIYLLFFAMSVYTSSISIIPANTSNTINNMVETYTKMRK